MIRSGCFVYEQISDTDGLDFIQYESARLVGHDKIFAAISIKFVEGSDWVVSFYQSENDSKPCLTMTLGQCYDKVYAKEMEE